MLHGNMLCIIIVTKLGILSTQIELKLCPLLPNENIHSFVPTDAATAAVSPLVVHSSTK